MLETGKASRTVYPDGTVGVFFRIDKDVYEKFTKKCEENGLKKKFKLVELIKKFTK
jgi:hypothetical protein